MIRQTVKVGLKYYYDNSDNTLTLASIGIQHFVQLSIIADDNLLMSSPCKNRIVVVDIRSKQI